MKTASKFKPPAATSQNRNERATTSSGGVAEAVLDQEESRNCEMGLAESSLYQSGLTSADIQLP